MTEDEFLVVISQHLFSYKYRCACGEHLGSNPDDIARHLARKIYEAQAEHHRTSRT